MHLIINNDNISLTTNYTEVDPNHLETLINNNLFCDYNHYSSGKGSIFMNNRYKHLSNSMLVAINWMYPINRDNPINVYVSIYKILNIDQDLLRCIGTVNCNEQLLKEI